MGTTSYTHTRANITVEICGYVNTVLNLLGFVVQRGKVWFVWGLADKALSALHFAHALYPRARDAINFLGDLIAFVKRAVIRVDLAKEFNLLRRIC